MYLVVQYHFFIFLFNMSKVLGVRVLPITNDDFRSRFVLYSILGSNNVCCKILQSSEMGGGGGA